MNTVLITGQSKVVEQLQREVPYFLEYTREIVVQVLTWDIDIIEMNRQVLYTQQVVEDISQAKDLSYERWDYGRPGIMDGGPNEVQYFERERQRCLEILWDIFYMPDGFQEISDLKTDIYRLETYLKDNNMSPDYFKNTRKLDIEVLRQNILRMQYRSVKDDKDKQVIKNELLIDEQWIKSLWWDINFFDLLSLRLAVADIEK